VRTTEMGGTTTATKDEAARATTTQVARAPGIAGAEEDTTAGAVSFAGRVSTYLATVVRRRRRHRSSSPRRRKPHYYEDLGVAALQ
jgi:hypothetical protein